MAADGAGGISRERGGAWPARRRSSPEAAKGLGKHAYTLEYMHAIVEELAGFGARVHTCSRNAAELEECRPRWEEKGLPVTGLRLRRLRARDREKLMETVNQTFDGKLDILVNNAGQMPLKAAVEWTADEYSKLMTTNLESCFHLSQLAHPLLIRASIAGGGSIVNISISGSIAYRGVALYVISKGTPDSFRRNQSPFGIYFPCGRLFNNRTNLCVPS
ncbi:hypothetical protein ACQ4PT_064152 [Festuca glaucescens]